MRYTQLAVSVLSGLAVCIPLVIKLIEYVQKAVKEKNWGALMKLIMDYMAQAETMFADGADRRQWVLAMVASSAKSLNCEADPQTVGRMIDELCDMSKAVNAA